MKKPTFELNVQWLSFSEQKEHTGTEHVASVYFCYKDVSMGSLEGSLESSIQKSTGLILRKSEIILEEGLTTAGNETSLDIYMLNCCYCLYTGHLLHTYYVL